MLPSGLFFPLAARQRWAGSCWQRHYFGRGYFLCAHFGRRLCGNLISPLGYIYGKLGYLLQNLSVGYNGVPVLSDINATLPGGKVSVILGGSGCGKSTLLRHVIGLAKTHQGRYPDWRKRFVYPFHEMISAGYAKRMGVLFFRMALSLARFTLAQNVVLPLSEHLRLQKKLLREAALRVLRMVGLEEFADYYPNQLSGGMRKRAGLARAIIADPALLLCDEPTSGLDPITAARMDNLLLSMHAKYPGMTIVSVSHDLASLKTIADYVLVLGEGRAIFAGTLQELYASKNTHIWNNFWNVTQVRFLLILIKNAIQKLKKTLQKWLDS